MEPALLTHLQFAVIDCLQGRTLKGRELRDRLESEKNIRKEGPAFYMMMGRLEEAGLIVSATSDVVIGGKTYKEKEYRVTSEGHSAYEATRRFYSGSSEWSPLPA